MWFVPQGRSQSRGYKKIAYGFISIDVTRLYYKNNPFVLATQAESEYYVCHSSNANWHTRQNQELPLMY